MLDLKPEEWIQICYVKNNELCFTQEYLNLTQQLGWGARKFAAHLATYWSKDFETVLDYFGPEEADEDIYSGIDGEEMDVGEKHAEHLEYKGIPFPGLDIEWYRDVMRAKLTTLKLPERLIKEYVQQALKAQERDR